MVKLSKNFLYYFYYCQKNEEILDQKDKVEKYSVILNRDIPLNLTFSNLTVTQLFLPDLKSKLKTLENMTACFFQKSG